LLILFLYSCDSLLFLIIAPNKYQRNVLVPEICFTRSLLICCLSDFFHCTFPTLFASLNPAHYVPTPAILRNPRTGHLPHFGTSWYTLGPTIFIDQKLKKGRIINPISGIFNSSLHVLKLDTCQ
jgi:hypothetical protein